MSSKNVTTTKKDAEGNWITGELKFLWSACAAIAAFGLVVEVKNARTPREVEITDNSLDVVPVALVPVQLTQ